MTSWEAEGSFDLSNAIAHAKESTRVATRGLEQVDCTEGDLGRLLNSARELTAFSHDLRRAIVAKALVVKGGIR